jgi:hypothetical protein
MQHLNRRPQRIWIDAPTSQEGESGSGSGGGGRASLVCRFSVCVTIQGAHCLKGSVNLSTN